MIYESTLEKFRVVKIELGIVERQIEATRRGYGYKGNRGRTKRL